MLRTKPNDEQDKSNERKHPDATYRLLVRWITTRQANHTLPDQTIAVGGLHSNRIIQIDGKPEDGAKLLRDKATVYKNQGIEKPEGKSALLNIIAALQQLSKPRPAVSEFADELLEAWITFDGRIDDAKTLAIGTVAFSVLVIGCQIMVDNRREAADALLEDKAMTIYRHGLDVGQGSSLSNIVQALHSIAGEACGK